MERLTITSGQFFGSPVAQRAVERDQFNNAHAEEVKMKFHLQLHGPKWQSDPRTGRAIKVIVGSLVASLALAACGVSGSPSVANLGTTTTTIASSGTSQELVLLGYSSCMRSHGVPHFPDPTGSDGVPKETAQQLGVSQTQLQAAQSDCKHILPGGSLSGANNQTITVAQQQYYLKAAACMHSHGVTNFPEPSFFAGSVEFQGLGHLPGVHSPLFARSFLICRKLIPVGLPYGVPSGT
jgi:hypothetical protein